MFRQDRTNPSTAVSTWKGRKDTPKGHPSTAVSKWLNGGLFGESWVPITASGGDATNDYTDSTDGITYRSHVFEASGTFTVSDITGASSTDLQIHILGGGGSGGSVDYSTGQGGGGGGGANVLTTATAPTVIV